MTSILDYLILVLKADLYAPMADYPRIILIRIIKQYQEIIVSTQILLIFECS